MCLIDDDGVVAPQLWIRREFRQQQPIGHQHQAGGIRYLIGKPHSKTDAAAQRLTDFLGDTRGQGTRGQPPRLGVRNEGVDAAAQLQTVLRQLGALAGTGIAGDDQHLLALQRLHDGLAALGNRQIGVALESQRRRHARGAQRVASYGLLTPHV